MKKSRRRCQDEQVKKAKIRRRGGGRDRLKQVEEERSGRNNDWVNMPEDIMFIIFSKLNTMDLLLHVQFACSYWLQLAKDRHLFRSVLLPEEAVVNTSSFVKEMLIKNAVSRSCGELMEISLDQDWCTEELLHYVVSNSLSLKRLRLTSSYHDPRYGVSSRGLAEACRKIPLLEELEVNHVDIRMHDIQLIGTFCPQLRCFELNAMRRSSSFDLAFAIARVMPQLRVLRISSTELTDIGLQAIVNECTLLENLHLRDCWSSTRLCDDLVKRCLHQIKHVTFPSRKWPPRAEKRIRRLVLYTQVGVTDRINFL